MHMSPELSPVFAIFPLISAFYDFALLAKYCAMFLSFTLAPFLVFFLTSMPSYVKKL